MSCNTLFRFWAAAALAGALLLTVSGCGKVAEEVAEKAMESSMPEGSKVEIDENKNQVSIQTTDGAGGAVSVQAGESVAFPADFPEDIPVPGGVTWNLVQSSSADSASGVIVQGMLSTPVADVAAFMKQGLEAKGWKQENAFQQAGEMEMLTYSKEERMVHVTATKADSQTALVISSQ